MNIQKCSNYIMQPFSTFVLGEYIYPIFHATCKEIMFDVNRKGYYKFVSVITFWLFYTATGFFFKYLWRLFTYVSVVKIKIKIFFRVKLIKKFISKQEHITLSIILCYYIELLHYHWITVIVGYTIEFVILTPINFLSTFYRVK